MKKTKRNGADAAYSSWVVMFLCDGSGAEYLRAESVRNLGWKGFWNSPNGGFFTHFRVKYAFGVVHAHGAIWKECGLLTAQGKQIRHAEEILKWLQAVKQPGKIAVMHCGGHQNCRF